MPIRKNSGLKPHVAKPHKPRKSFKLRPTAELSTTKDGIIQRKHDTDPRVKYDWDEIRQHYVEADETLSANRLSKLFGPNYQHIARKMSAERWKYQRAQYQAEQANARQQAKQKWSIDESEKFDKQAHAAGQLGLAVVMARLIEIQQLQGAHRQAFGEVVARVAQGLPLQKGEKWGIVDYRELESLARAALSFQEVGRKALGSDIQNFKFDADIDIHSVEEVVHIGEALSRDDPDRLADFMEAMARAGLMGKMSMPVGDRSVIDLDSGDVTEVSAEQLALGGGEIIDDEGDSIDEY